jgi:hypothetical protein
MKFFIKTLSTFLLSTALVAPAVAQNVIADYPAATTINPTDLFLLQQGPRTTPYTNATSQQLQQYVLGAPNFPTAFLTALAAALAAPPPIGGTTPNTGAFSTLSTTGQAGGNNFKILPTVPSTATDGPNLNSTRNATHTGGTPGFVVSNGRFYTNVGAGVTNSEWPLLSILDDYHTAASPENVAVYIQANHRSTGPTGGAVIESTDYTLLPSSTGGSQVSLEIDNTTGGADDVPGTPKRTWLQLVGAQTPGAPSLGEVGLGISIGFRPGQGSIQTVLGFRNAVPITQAVFDITGATLSAGVPVIKTVAGNTLWDRNGTGIWTVSTSGGAIHFAQSGTDYLQLLDNGTVNAAALVKSPIMQATPAATQIAYSALGTLGAVGFDAASGVFSGPAFRMKADQVFALSADNTVTVRWDGTTSRFKFAIAGVDMFSVDTVGAVRAKGVITGSTTP